MSPWDFLHWSWRKCSGNSKSRGLKLDVEMADALKRNGSDANQSRVLAQARHNVTWGATGKLIGSVVTNLIWKAVPQLRCNYVVSRSLPGDGQLQSFRKVLLVLQGQLSGPETTSFRKLSRHEAKRFIGTPQCLQCAKDISNTFRSSFAAIDNSSPSFTAGRGSACAPTCQAILRDSRPGGHLARAQDSADAEDAQRAAQSRYGRID
jgi:hypothetical protein